MPKSGVLKSYPIKTEGTAATKKQRFLFFRPHKAKQIYCRIKQNILPTKKPNHMIRLFITTQIRTLSWSFMSGVAADLSLPSFLQLLKQVQLLLRKQRPSCDQHLRRWHRQIQVQDQPWQLHQRQQRCQQR